MHVMYVTNGYKQVQMGGDGCVWVRWGAGGIGNAKIRQAGGIYGVTGQNLGAMAGEISPDIMCCVFCRKWLRMSAYTLFMHMDGCNGACDHKGEKKQDKKSPYWGSMVCFVMHVRGGKIRNVTGTVMVVREGQGE